MMLLQGYGYQNLLTLLKWMFVLGQFLTLSAEPLRCPLQWKSYSVGFTPPSGSVYLNNKEGGNFVIRGVSALSRDNDDFRIGRYDHKTGRAYIFNGNEPEQNPKSLEILINNLDCSASWESKTPPISHRIPNKSGSSSRFVGNTTYGGEILIGEIDANKNVIIVIDKNNVRREVRTFSYLQSISDGIHVLYSDLDFGKEPFKCSIDVMGMDAIDNFSDAIVTQTLEHRKTLTTSKSFTDRINWSIPAQISFGFKVSISLDIPGTGISLGLGDVGMDTSFGPEQVGAQPSKSYGEVKTEEIKTTRKIVVPPYVSIQACTIFGMMDKFSRDYTAVGTYTAKGWTGQELLDYMNQKPNPPKNMVAYSTYVKSTESGTFSGELSVNNALIVFNGEDTERDCTTVVDIVEKMKRARVKRMRMGVESTSEELELGQQLADILKINPKPMKALNGTRV